MVPGRRYTPRYIFGVLKRRWLLVGAPLVLVAALAALLARALPDVYVAQGTVLIVPQQIPESYVRSTVTVPISERLRATALQIKSADTLASLIKEFDLYRDVRDTVSTDALVAWMASNIGIELTRANTIVVGYSSYDPAVVAKVAARLLQLVIDGSLRDRRQLADSASKFLDSELESTRSRLVEQEHRVQAFRERYAGQLSTQVPANLQILQGWQTQLQGVMEELKQERNRRTQLLDFLATDPGAGTEASNGAATKESDQRSDLAASAQSAVPEPSTPTDPLAQQLAAAQALMAQLLKKYTPQYPDVVQLQSTIADLEKAVTASAATRPADVPHVEGKADPAPGVARRQAAQTELTQLDLRIQERESLERTLRDNVETYQARIEAVPSRESEWVALTRDYQTLQQTYASMLAKREESNLSANLELRRIGEQFRIIAEPVPPSRPASPNRPSIILIGLLLGICCGLVLPILLEVTDSKLRAENEVVNALRLPVLAMLPHLMTTIDLRQRGVRRLRLGVAALILCVAAAAAAAVLPGILWPETTVDRNAGQSSKR